MLAVDARVDAEGGGLQLPVALQHAPVEVHQQQVAGAELRPVLAEGVDQEGVRPLRRREAEVVADALVEIEAGRQAQRRSQIDPRPGQRVVHSSRSEEHTSELQSLMRISYAVFCLKKKTDRNTQKITICI